MRIIIAVMVASILGILASKYIDRSIGADIFPDESRFPGFEHRDSEI